MPRWTFPFVGTRHTRPGLLAVAAPLLLAGLLPLPAEMSSRWGVSGCWLNPVGDPYVTPRDSADRTGDYRAVRGLRDPGGKRRGHDGVDLSNARGGGPVRAAGNGMVIKVADAGWNHGYGRHVVIAHRLVEGTLCYSVYAHLAPGAATVRRGEYVAAGRVIGKVGMTGRATSPHLHFEVRLPDDPEARWENAAPVDPLVFVTGRLPDAGADSSWARPYLEWARCAALLPGDAAGGTRTTRAEWWRALLLATRSPLERVPAGGASLRAAVIALRLLPEGSREDPEAGLRWTDLARDVPRVRELGLRLPHSPVDGARRRADCRRELGTGAPAQAMDSLANVREGGPSRAQLCLVLADLAGDPPARPKARRRPSRKTSPAKPSG